jgi:hypothetical protein
MRFLYVNFPHSFIMFVFIKKWYDQIKRKQNRRIILSLYRLLLLLLFGSETEEDFCELNLVFGGNFWNIFSIF